MEHSLGTKSHVEKPEGLWEHFKKTGQESSILQISSKHRTVLGMWLVPLSGVGYASELTSDHSLLAAMTQLNV